MQKFHTEIIVRERVANNRGNGWRLPKGNPPLLVSDLGHEAREILFKGYFPGYHLTSTSVFREWIFTKSLVFLNNSLFKASGLIRHGKFVLEIAGLSHREVGGKICWNDFGKGFSWSFMAPFYDVKAGVATVAYRHQHFAFEAKSAGMSNSPIDLSLSLGGIGRDFTIGAKTRLSRMTRISKFNAALGFKFDDGSNHIFKFDPLRKKLEMETVAIMSPYLSVGLMCAYGPTIGHVLATSQCIGMKLCPRKGVSLKLRTDNSNRFSGVFEYEFEDLSKFSMNAKWDPHRSPKWSVGLSLDVLNAGKVSALFDVWTAALGLCATRMAVHRDH